MTRRCVERRSHLSWTAAGAGAVLAVLLLASPIVVSATQRPNMLLLGATLEDARDFAVDSARSRGWSVLSVTADTATFEQTLEETETDEAVLVLRLVRIVAELAEEFDGVRVYLRADEVESLDTGEEWLTDVTGRYERNLMNALSSLRVKWDDRRATLPRRPREITAPVTSATAPPDAGDAGARAYHAELYAQGLGCELSDTGTTLESTGPDWQRYRVFCRSGAQVRVECRYGECIEAR